MGKCIAVLVIDDEQLVADALEMILLDMGYEVSVAQSGHAGLELFDKQPFDVIISDFRLPDMTGLDVLSRIRQKTPDSKVIIITAYSTPEVIAESMSLGAVGVLSKPFIPSDILKLIDIASGNCHSLKHGDSTGESG
jgi:DNA-binding NtrC family response regulator